jgi:hypothetical protein
VRFVPLWPACAVRVQACAWLCVVAACGGFAEGNGPPWDPTGTTGGGPPTTSPLDDSTSSPDEGSGEEDSSGGVDPDSEGEGSTGEPEMFDCTPQWTTPWIGSPCAADGDCTYDGGFCLLESDGFPCGTCSQSCDSLCPDIEGTPETFCVDGSDVGIDAAGYCLSQCDPGLLGGEGCRDGYGCAGLDRFNDPSASAGVCVPQEFADMGDTDCQTQLVELGAVFTPYDHQPESPDGYPELTCTIEDAVFLHSPVNGIPLRYIESAEDGEILVSCQTAISVVGSVAVADMLGAAELIHYGTYNCRVIAGTSTLSQHGLGYAVDIAGFTMDDGSEVTVLNDWEDGNPNPTTTFGQFLLAFTDAIWDMNLWNIILTPEYNAAHDNHFHVDLTPGGNTYSRP